MIDAGRLLADLKRLRADLEDDLRVRCEEHPDLDRPLRDEHDAAHAAGRTAQPYAVWRDARLTQIAAAWLLGCVFVRFLEDNRLVDPPRLSGPGDRRRRALDEHTLYFRAHPTDTDREYLLHVFREVAAVPAAAPLFDPGHNPIGTLDPSADAARRTLRPSGDAAARLLGLWQRIDPDAGGLAHDFTDPERDTRFLGDLYQDLSDEARKRFALLQTPAFVEEFILDRTLTPAVEEFGFRAVRLIDPACGSGHFLLGAFRRLDARWARDEPGTNPRERARRVLAQIAGVDLNPFAAAIARFRLLVAALGASGVERLADAPAFDVRVAAGDALLHGPRPGLEGARKRYLEAAPAPPAPGADGAAADAPDADGAAAASGDVNARMTVAPGADGAAAGASDAVFDDPLAHVYRTEDAAALRAILGGRYHAVVGNPPYVTPKDPAINRAYRERFDSCHGKYSLAAPFTERFFDLAFAPPPGAAEPAGFVGMITANSFMKREFGRKLIGRVLPRRDLTHVVDTSGAYVPGHGTPTVILFGRPRPPVAGTVRTVMGVRGEPSTPEDPAAGLVWSAIVAQIDRPGSESAFVSVADVPRARFARHPWSLGGGGAAELKELLEANCERLLGSWLHAVGRTTVVGEDDVWILSRASAARAGVSKHMVGFVVGESLRDWQLVDPPLVIYPYQSLGGTPVDATTQLVTHYLWPYRTLLAARSIFGKRLADMGRTWHEHLEHYREKLRTPLSIAFAFVATHNHFVLDRGGKVFNRTAPVIKLPADATEDNHLGLVGLLSSSTACFWLKQVCHNKGGGGEWWEQRYEYDGTKLLQFPVPAERPLALARTLDALARERADLLPAALAARGAPTADALRAARARAGATRERMIALQEELDWRCHRIYGVTGDDLCLPAGAGREIPDVPAVRLGERAFEIVLARKCAAGEVETKWFERHGAAPVTAVPDRWPAAYRALVERRIAAIEAQPALALIEQPAHKRRWSDEPWEAQQERALRGWLLDRLEAPAHWSEPRLTTAAALADRMREDDAFLEVAALHAGRIDFDVTRLVADLVEGASVPLLPAVRCTPSGLRKRAAWERTWDLQRREDALDARTALPPADPARLTPEQAAAAKARDVGAIPVPPRYAAADFRRAAWWRLRGKLDVPKERFFSLPGCARDADPSLLVGWAGWNALERSRAVAAWLIARKEQDGWPAARLLPLLAALRELLPWVRQRHNAPDPDFGVGMGDYFAGFLDEEARALGLSDDAIRGWAPAETRRRRDRRPPRDSSTALARIAHRHLH